MNLKVNESQLRVLQWIADGADLTAPPVETFKISALALQNRDLVKVSRRRGVWNAALTDTGAFFLEHGHHPRDVSDSSARAQRSRHTPPARRETPRASTPRTLSGQASASFNAQTRTTGALRAPGPDETIPILETVRKPHQAVRELIEHKARLQVPADQQRRAIRILHSLVTEALRRGWSVTANPSTISQNPWNGRKTRVAPGPDLFWIDAGHKPAALRLRMKQKRVAHVPTQKERDDMVRFHWRSYPKYDYVSTDLMRLEIRDRSSSALTLEDTASTSIEDKLLRAVLVIEKQSADALKTAERQRQIQMEQLERQRRAEKLRRRAERYSNWFDTLEQLRLNVARHRDLADTVAQLREAVRRRGPQHDDAEALADYLSWAEEHLAQSDPFATIQLPPGERPDMDFAPWRQWKQQQTQRW